MCYLSPCPIVSFVLVICSYASFQNGWRYVVIPTSSLVISAYVFMLHCFGLAICSYASLSQYFCYLGLRIYLCQLCLFDWHLWACRLPPSSVAVPPASTSQEMSVETVLPPQLLDTLVTKVANKVSCCFVAVPLAQSITPGSSQLMEVAVCPSLSIPTSTVASTPTSALSVLDSGPAPTSSSVFPEEVASRVVQQSVATAANSLTGPSVQAPIEMPGQLFQSAGLSVAACVSKKLQAKIWNHEYVDFGSLLPNPVFENQYRLTFQGADSGPVPSLCLEPVSKPKRILSIELWLASFHVFVANYTKKFPHKAPALMNMGK